VSSSKSGTLEGGRSVDEEEEGGLGNTKVLLLLGAPITLGGDGNILAILLFVVGGEGNEGNTSFVVLEGGGGVEVFLNVLEGDIGTVGNIGTLGNSISLLLLLGGGDGKEGILGTFPLLLPPPLGISGNTGKLTVSLLFPRNVLKLNVGVGTTGKEGSGI
jgi:hypothetical protein